MPEHHWQHPGHSHSLFAPLTALATWSQPPDRGRARILSTCGNADLVELLWLARRFPAISCVEYMEVAEAVAAAVVYEYRRRIDGYEYDDYEGIVGPQEGHSKAIVRLLSSPQVTSLPVSSARFVPAMAEMVEIPGIMPPPVTCLNWLYHVSDLSSVSLPPPPTHHSSYPPSCISPRARSPRTVHALTHLSPSTNHQPADLLPQPRTTTTQERHAERRVLQSCPFPAPSSSDLVPERRSGAGGGGRWMEHLQRAPIQLSDLRDRCDDPPAPRA